MTPSDERMPHIETVHKKYANQLMRKSHVVGVSIGRAAGSDNELVLVVLVDKNIPNHQREPGDRIPHMLEGVPVVTRTIGTIRAQ